MACPLTFASLLPRSLLPSSKRPIPDRRYESALSHPLLPERLPGGLDGGAVERPAQGSGRQSAESPHFQPHQTAPHSPSPATSSNAGARVQTVTKSVSLMPHHQRILKEHQVVSILTALGLAVSSARNVSLCSCFQGLT